MASDPNSATPPIGHVLLKGSAWMVGLRWGMKCLGLLNTAIIARLLTPEDFGLIAMAMAVVSLSRVLFELGVDHALIQRVDATKAHFDTAWSLQLIQASLVVAALVLGAPAAAAHFNEPRVETILPLLAIAVFLQGSRNIGIVTFRKELEFHKEFRFLMLSKVIAVGFSIALALWLRDYRALVAGIIAGYAIEWVLSYLMHPFRPSLSLAKMRDLWSFSKWMLVLQTATYVNNRADRLLLGGLVPPARLGHYTLGGELAEMTSAEFVAPISRSLAPGFAKLQREPERLDRAYLKAVGASAMVSLPMAVGLAAIAGDAVSLLLGDQWTDAVVFVQILCLAAAFQGLASISANLLVVTGSINAAAVAAGIRACVLLALFYPLFERFAVEGVAAAQVVTSLIGCALLYGWVSHSRALALSKILGCLVRPLLATAAMAAVLFAFPLPIDALLARTAATVGLGAAVYSVTLVVLWKLSNDPDGAEAALLEMLREKLG